MVALADSLVELRHHAFVPHAMGQEVVALWDRIPARDKDSLDFPARYRDDVSKGRYRKTSTCVEVNTLMR